MRGLTVKQPWAGHLVRGEKEFETRSWRTHYRGPLVIQASSRPPYADEPTGAIVGVVDLVDIVPVELLTRGLFAHLSATEGALGDFTAGRFAWRVAHPRRLRYPIPCRGTQSLWPVSLDLQRRIRAGLSAFR